MNKKIIWIIIGFVISGVVLYPLKKKIQEESKRQEEEAMKMVNEMAKQAMDEERRHMMAMQDIERKGEQERQKANEAFREDMNELVKKVGTSMADYNAATAKDVFHCIMKYKDMNGVIHKFDAADPKQFMEVMKDRTNILIFD